MNQTETKLGHSLRVEIEQLEGGFISNVSGKRRIYNDAHDIDDAINFKSILTNLQDGEYTLSLDVIPKGMSRPCNEEEVITSNPIVHVTTEDDGLSILERAKRDGIIQPADVFDPIKPVVTEDTTKPIAITEFNSYTIAQLNAIPWAKYDKEMPLSTKEKSDISGINGSTMYNLWNKVMAGTFQWQSVNTKIGMTILAKYYERVLDKKVNTVLPPDVPAPTNSKRLLEILDELELVANTNKFVKAGIVSRKILEMKKLIH